MRKGIFLVLRSGPAPLKRRKAAITVTAIVLFVFGGSILLTAGCSSTQFKGPEFLDQMQEKPAEQGAAGAETAAEREVIRSINFVGNRAYKDSILMKKLGFKAGDYLDPVLAEAYRGTLVEFYHNNGFVFAEVALDSERFKDGVVVYNIKEASRVRITRVKFSGNKAIKTSSLKKAIKTKTRKWLVMPRYYVAESVAEDILRLQNIYYDKGYLDYRVEPKVSFSENRKRAHITFEIEEGPLFTVRDVIFEGAVHFDEQALRAGLKLKQGKPYYGRLAVAHARQITKLYAEQGYIDAKVEQSPQFIAGVNMVNVLFEITEGRQFRIGRIDITGNEQVQDKVIRRVLDEHDFTPGELYNADIAPRSGGGKLETEVQRMVLAEEVMIRPVEPVSGEPDQKDAKVDVKEGRTGMIMIGGAVSSDSEIMGQLVYNQQNFDISDRPESFKEFIKGDAFKGAGQNLRIAAEPGTEVSQYSVTYTNPYFRDKPMSLDVAGSSWSRYMECYDEERIKGYVGFEKRLKNEWRKSIGIRCETIDVGSLDVDAPKEIVNVKGSNYLAGVRFGISRDLRDDKWYPSSGRWYDASYEQVAGDEVFGVLSGTYRWYKTLHEDLAERKTVLALKLLGGAILGDAQPFEKFYAGGTGTYGIRGFDYRGISPRGRQRNVVNPQRKDPIGSEWIFLANTEVTVPLASDNFAALFFLDSGAVETGGYRASVGIGLQIMIQQWFGPVPMRIEIAAPFMKNSEDKTRTFSFSVGRLF
jgi:outer membrane protein insertion porin family